MQVTCVSVFVKPEHIRDFIAATAENHRGSIQEPGNLRFDVLQSAENPARFCLYEAYASETAAAAHKQTPHYLKWRETVAPWMTQPREGLIYRVLLPERADLWK